jgi:hypothetical protein
MQRGDFPQEMASCDRLTEVTYYFFLISLSLIDVVAVTDEIRPSHSLRALGSNNDGESGVRGLQKDSKRQTKLMFGCDAG